MPPRKRRFADVTDGGHSPLDHAVSQRDRNVLQIVRDALRHKETVLAYQPVVVSPGNRIAFHEGLIRVLDETSRIIPARDFMPLIEKTEVGRQIDTQALRMGLMALKNNPTLRLSINMSARSIGYRPWNQLLRQHLTRRNNIAERLILEISEKSAMLMPDVVGNFMLEMQDLGICFALDNFGAGQTAIRYFRDFYFDIVKVDGQFIRGISQNPDNRVVTEALVGVAHKFDMLTVAEHVENPDDAALVMQMGFDCMQGMQFGAPTTRPPWHENGHKMRTG